MTTIKEALCRAGAGGSLFLSAGWSLIYGTFRTAMTTEDQREKFYEYARDEDGF